MNITLSPIRGLPGQPGTVLSVSGDTLDVDGTAFDLSPVPEGGQATPEGDHPFIGPITRVDGEIACTVRVILGDDAALDQPRDPAHWIVAVASGAVEIPYLRRKNEVPA